MQGDGRALPERSAPVRLPSAVGLPSLRVVLLMAEAPDPREDEDCPGPEVCGFSCDQHEIRPGDYIVRASVAAQVDAYVRDRLDRATCPDTGAPMDECLCMTHDPDGAHYRARIQHTRQGPCPCADPVEWALTAQDLHAKPDQPLPPEEQP